MHDTYTENSVHTTELTSEDAEAFAHRCCAGIMVPILDVIKERGVTEEFVHRLLDYIEQAEISHDKNSPSIAKLQCIFCMHSVLVHALRSMTAVHISIIHRGLQYLLTCRIDKHSYAYIISPYLESDHLNNLSVHDRWQVLKLLLPEQLHDKPVLVDYLLSCPRKEVEFFIKDVCDHDVNILFTTLDLRKDSTPRWFLDLYWNHARMDWSKKLLIASQIIFFECCDFFDVLTHDVVWGLIDDIMYREDNWLALETDYVRQLIQLACPIIDRTTLESLLRHSQKRVREGTLKALQAQHMHNGELDAWQDSI